VSPALPIITMGLKGWARRRRCFFCFSERFILGIIDGGESEISPERPK
jgi:hypothetical protein